MVKELGLIFRFDSPRDSLRVKVLPARLQYGYRFSQDTGMVLTTRPL